MRKPAFYICENKTQISLAVTAKLISAFVFATKIVQPNTKFPASSQLVWLYSLVCVRPGRKSRRPVLSQRGSNVNRQNILFLFRFPWLFPKLTEEVVAKETVSAILRNKKQIIVPWYFNLVVFMKR